MCPHAAPARPAHLEDLVGIEHTKLGFFEQLRHKIEELETKNQETEDRRRETAAILDGISDLMMVLTEDLKIISVNHVFNETFPDIPNPEGHYCFELFRHETHPCPECPAFRSLSTNKVCKETAIFRIDGTNRHYEMIASPLKNQEWPKHRVLIFKRDVTMEKIYQAKYYQAEKMATLGVLATGVAHEVNNPLAAISGYAQGLQRKLARIADDVDPSMADDFREYTKTIVNECNRCRDIVHSLLTFGHPVCTFSPMSINDIVTETLKLLEHYFKSQPQIKVQTALTETLPISFGDAPQIMQVLLNLLTNAVDALTSNPDAARNGGTITIRTSTTPAEDWIRLEVSDTGCGIPMKNKDKLFEPFFTTKPVGKGIGVGLSTCYNIVRGHKGEITVESQIGKGSRFIVVLPTNPDDINA
ncbi:two-component system sensor histidine kinase NtrB [Oceanidesulfovibrio marinus]|uniref:histidine kinase n=1 Tax=Oceanidesulfovibrio marinus TaxID=370038 RepID=A0A6P1ZBP5_9BACT|nr:ATP-binding protein [Oceanidesulfovibrio marinus]QJT11316.1 PAS domain-containing sensor histidine kinase [Oceanidesulfovibrio marinus]TVM30155.1 PAS domain-containing sensor histidine kinase [Oceanidesulfovibrio marinus]